MWGRHVGRSVERRGLTPTLPSSRGGTVTKGGHFKGSSVTTWWKNFGAIRQWKLLLYKVFCFVVIFKDRLSLGRKGVSGGSFLK